MAQPSAGSGEKPTAFLDMEGKIYLCIVIKTYLCIFLLKRKTYLSTVSFQMRTWVHVVEIKDFTNCRTWLFFNKYVPLFRSLST